MIPGPDHLIIAPILIPLVAGAMMLFYEDRQRREKRIISVISCIALLLAAFGLVGQAQEAGAGGHAVGVYLLGDWPPPFAILLVLDRLSGMMLLLTAALSLATLVFSFARWDKEGQHFHSLFQFMLMGLNGAFLTGDLFNLFVFFEIMLAASYGLALHGSGPLRVRAGLHYIAINLAASLLFLIGVSLIYGVTGTLNMADLATRVPLVAAADRPLLSAGAAILGLAFLVKAAMWPLGFWLPITYMAAAPPVAAMFAMLTKVGVYIILRISSLAFGAGATHMAGLGADFLATGGMATIAFGMVGVLASQGLGRLAGCSVLVSSGTVITVAGLVGLGGGAALMAAGLFYLVVSTLAIAALFLMVELVEREQGGVAALLTVTAEAYGLGDEEHEEMNPDDLGPVVPGAMTVLGLCFLACTVLVAGLPPLAGFLGKFAMLSAALNSGGLAEGRVSGEALGFTALLLLSGIAALIALVREGIRSFWATEADEAPALPLVEIVPVVALLAVTVFMTVEARQVMRYMEATASSLHHPHLYTEGVLKAQRRTGAVAPDPEPEAEEGADAEAATGAER